MYRKVDNEGRGEAAKAQLIRTYVSDTSPKMRVSSGVFRIRCSVNSTTPTETHRNVSCPETQGHGLTLV